MNCPYCGKALDNQAQFCSQCGKLLDPVSLQANQPMFSPVYRPHSVSFGGKKTVGFIFTLIVLIFLAIGGLVFGIFYGIANSDSAKLSVRFLKASPEAAEALGTIEKVGWPLGSIKISGGGSGFASFSFSVTGSKASGKFYSSLSRINGLWRISSARLQLQDGRSVELPSQGMRDLSPPPD